MEHRYIMRGNIVTLIGFCLCIYFSYHALHGNRSFLKLLHLNGAIATMSQEYEQISRSRVEIEEKVLMMRPGSINRDLLEERVRITLGYNHKNDFIIFSDGKK